MLSVFLSFCDTRWADASKTDCRDSANTLSEMMALCELSAPRVNYIMIYHLSEFRESNVYTVKYSIGFQAQLLRGCLHCCCDLVI